MNWYSRIRLTLVVVGLFAFAAIPALAQDAEPLGAGEGAPIVEANFGGDIATLNPILSADGSSAFVIALLFPGLTGADPDTGLPVKGGPGALATDWTVSEDGLTYTFTLRDDWTWTDGTTITSADLKYSYDAIMSGEIDTRLPSLFENVESVEAPDATTLVVQFKTFDCGALTTAGYIPVVPAHKYQEVYPTYADMTTASDYNLNPDVTAGVFSFSNFRPGEQTTLLADQNYPDSELGYVVPEGFVFKQVADQIVEVEQFLAGDITLVGSVPDDRADELRALGEAGEIDYRERPTTSWHYVIFNVADPENPLDGMDENGEWIEQGHHPIFGDARVRQAFAMAIDHEALNQGAFNGLGSPIASPFLPQAWAYSGEVGPYAFDPEGAMALLDEAGFVDDDGDVETPRVATEDALYAEPGTLLEFDLTTFTGNPTIDSTSLLMQDQLKQVGFKMNLDIIEFQSMLDKVFGQTFDTTMLFLGPFDPNDPNTMFELIDPIGDVVGSGINPGSYSNARLSEIMKEARSLPGCDVEARKALYQEVEQIFHDELPVFLVTNAAVPIAAQANIENYDPRGASIRWNIPVWSVRPE